MSESTNAPEVVTPKSVAVRNQFQSEHAALKSAVGKVARQAVRDGHGDALALALRAYVGHQSYGTLSRGVKWTQADPTVIGGEGVPATGEPMVSMIDHIGTVLASLPAAAKGEGDDRKAAKAAVTALAKAMRA